MGTRPETQPPGKLVLKNVPDGTWVAEWLDTVENKWIQHTVEESRNGRLVITTPPVSRSVAIKLIKSTE